MSRKQFKDSARIYREFQKLADVIQNGERDDIKRALSRALRSPVMRGRQGRDMLRNLTALINGGRIPYSIFAMGGNSKLPFVSFSSLPDVTCPGAGDCLSFCYSFNAWRFPHAFGRQAQNAYLMRFRPEAIRADLERIAQRIGAPFDCRLYVDGDFATAGDVLFWMETLRALPSVRAYGYSKSFRELLTYDRVFGRDAWPTNYLLNMSSGHAHDAETVERVRALPITRGEFLAVNIGHKVSASDHGKPETNDAIRAAYRAAHATARAPFTCPGKCGACTPSGHACGSARFVGIPIAIAVH